MVAHFHYVLFGTIVFATYACIYFWFPKMTGRLMDERLGKWHFWTTFIGFHGTFLVQHWLGNEGMPRRYADYLPSDGFTILNSVSTIFAFVLGASTLPFLWNVFKSYRYGEVVTVDDPWGSATPSSGPPVAHRRGTTSPNCPGSAPSAPHSNCITRTWCSGCGRRPTSDPATEERVWPRTPPNAPVNPPARPETTHAHKPRPSRGSPDNPGASASGGGDGAGPTDRAGPSRIERTRPATTHPRCR